MVLKYLILLFIPTIYGRIAIKIRTGQTETDASVQFSGQNIEIISDKERETFKIGDNGLKKACETYVGAKPDDVFVKSPTPWNDIYHRYNWDQVRRTLKPVRWRVLGIHTKPVIVSTRVFENHSKVKAKYSAAISQEIEETVSYSWSIGGELTVGQDITYSVNFAAGSIGGTTSMSYTANWGTDTSKAKAVTLGSTTSVEVSLEPGQAVVATLSATHGTLELEVDYDAELSGRVFANYGNTYQGRHFWDFPVNMVLHAAGIPKYVNSTEKISVGFYTSAKVDIRGVPF